MKNKHQTISLQQFLSILILSAVCILFTVCTILPVCAKQPRTIRVGYFAFKGYHEMLETENGTIGSGYGYDFLQLLKRYTNLNFEYIGYENSWSDMLEMLRNKEIDLVTSVRKTPEREMEFGYSDSIGTGYAKLSVRKDDERYHLNDTDSFDGMQIGLLLGSSRNDDLQEYARSNGFSYTPVMFEDEEELSEALWNGIVDGIVTSSLRIHDHEKIVARFSLEEFYAIVRKEDSALLDEINQGIRQMDLHEGDWRNRLNYAYMSADQNDLLSFSPSEISYINDVKQGGITITACAQPDRKPYSYVEDGQLKGIIPEYFEHLMDMAGLPYETVIPENRQQYYTWMEKGTIDVFMDNATANQKHMESHTVLSDSYMELTLSRLTRKDFTGEIKTLAVAYDQMYEDPDRNIAEDVLVLSYDTRTEAMQSVRDGRADACYVYTYMAEQFVVQSGADDLIYHVVDGQAMPLSIGISAYTDHQLISIINACMKADQTSVMEELIENHTHATVAPVTFQRFLANNPWFPVTSAVVTAALILVSLLVVRNNRNMALLVEERKQHADMLETKNRQLQKSMMEAKRANLAKTTFLNHMSHDIRTPMNAIIGYTDIARRKNTDETVSTYLQRISDSSSHLLSLINDVLDISRIESGKTVCQKEPITLSDLLKTVTHITEGFLLNRDLTFVVECDQSCHVNVLGDEIRIKEILVNILSNAVKFTPDHGEIRFISSCIPQDDDYILFETVISDTGIGMSKSFLNHVFDEFAQEENGARTQYKGTGLGLAITKRYVKMMDGTISVSSEKGKGTAFTVQIPMQKTDLVLKEELDEAVSSYALEHLSVLLVEDNDLNAQIVEIQLEDKGMHITRAVNGMDAVNRFKESAEGTFDVILMDIMMPVMNGYEAARTIRNLNDRTDAKNIPIIAMTANAFAEDVQASLSAGMDAHLSKPVNMEEMTRVIYKYVSLRRHL